MNLPKDEIQDDLSKKSVKDLKCMCKEKGIKGYSNKKKDALIKLIKNNEITPISYINPIPDSNVLEICKIPDMDILKLKEYLRKYMESRREFYKETNRSLYIEDEFSEWWISTVTNGKHVGKGNHCIDVITELNDGIDVMCVTLNDKMTNEKSLIQNFSDSGADLDNLFKEKNDIKAVDLFKNNYYDKIKSTKDDKKLKNLYILSFISTLNDTYMACFKLYPERINNIISGGFVGNKKEHVNINIHNFIDSRYGNVKLYKSKKRMELRLHKPIIDNEYTIKLYSY